MNAVEGEHRPMITGGGQIMCACGWSHGGRWASDSVLSYAKHYALEEQAKKPRARRGGVDDSEPTSESHIATWHMLDDIEWQTARDVHGQQVSRGTVREYTPQRIRTCLAGLVRAGMAEERKVGRHREYRRRAFG